MHHARAEESTSEEPEAETTAFFNLTWWQILCLALGAAAIIGVGVWIGMQRVRNKKKLKQMPDPLLPTVDPRALAQERKDSGLSDATVDSLGSHLDRKLIDGGKKQEGKVMHHRRHRPRDERQRHRRKDERIEREEGRDSRKRFRDSVFSSYHSMKKAAVKLRYMEAKAKLKEELRREALAKPKDDKRKPSRARRDRDRGKRTRDAGRHHGERQEDAAETTTEGSKQKRTKRKPRGLEPRTRPVSSKDHEAQLSPASAYSQRDTVYLPAPAVGHIQGPKPKQLLPPPRKARRQKSIDEESYTSLDILSGYTSDEPADRLDKAKRRSAYPQQVDVEELVETQPSQGVAGINAAIWQTALQWGRKAGLTT